ncbi:MAG: hypothetical protein IKE53_01560 [Clostridiales bacterium]|nr:hypothetical protein [Clostridiales bacterium]
MKYSFELKKEIYEKHCEGYGSEYLSKKYGLDASHPTSVFPGQRQHCSIV